MQFAVCSLQFFEFWIRKLKNRMGTYRDLEVYKKAYTLSMEIFLVSKTFSLEEKYSLTDQIRRCSRSVCANFGEAYRRRKYPAHFESKLTDCDAENTETEI